MEYKGLPIYNITLSDEEDMMLMNSLVDMPAVCVNFLTFSEQEEKKPVMLFATDDNDQHIITGISILADTPIFRKDYLTDDGYYVVFTKETIKEIVHKYAKSGYQNLVDLQHDGVPVEGVIMLESYFINKERGICPKEFADCPDGSWVTSYKVENEEIWAEIKNGESLKGFSIEIISTLVPAEDNQHIEEEPEPEEEPEDDFWSWLMALLGDDEDDVEFIFTKKEKKKFKAVTKGDVKDIMSSNRQVDIELKSGETLRNQQIFQLGEFTEKDIQGHARPINVAVVYDPASGNWNTYELRNINSVTLLETELINYTFNPSWEAIAKDGTIGIIETAVGMAVGNSYSDAIETNLMAMIDYYDEENEDGIGFRNCLVTSWGYTTGMDGTPKNETIRVYEYNGVSHSGLTGGTGNWRFMLTRRIKDFKIAKYTEPILQAPDGYNGEAQSGSGKIGTMSNIKRLKSGERAVMQFPPIRKTK